MKTISQELTRFYIKLNGFSRDYHSALAVDCICIIEAINEDIPVRRYFRTHTNGAYDLRWLIVEKLAPFICAHYDAITNDEFDGSFDWDFLPAFFDTWINEFSEYKPHDITPH